MAMFSEKIVATESGSKEMLADGIRAIARPVIRGMFVGKVNDYQYPLV